jgi:hypothetical protein
MQQMQLDLVKVIKGNMTPKRNIKSTVPTVTFSRCARLAPKFAFSAFLAKILFTVFKKRPVWRRFRIRRKFAMIFSENVKKPSGKTKYT